MFKSLWRFNNKKKRGDKMKKKKFLVMLIASALMLSSCSNTSSSTNATTQANNKTTEATSKKDSNQESTSNKETEVQTETQVNVSFEEMTVVDNEECSIIISQIEPDNMWGYTIKVKLENKSTDKEYMFSVQSAAINGVQSDPFFASSVSAGKKSNDTIQFSKSSLKGNDIGEFTDIELTFRVHDNNDWTADEVAKETIRIYPYGEENSVLYVREPKETDTIIIDNEYVKATVIGYEEDSIWGYTVNLFLENKTDKEVMFSIDEVSVNGYMADPFFADSVIPGKSAFSSISWSKNTFTENSISKVEEIEFIFKAYDNSDWLADPFANENITLKP